MHVTHQIMLELMVPVGPCVHEAFVAGAALVRRVEVVGRLGAKEQVLLLLLLAEQDLTAVWFAGCKYKYNTK